MQLSGRANDHGCFRMAILGRPSRPMAMSHGAEWRATNMSALRCCSLRQHSEDHQRLPVKLSARESDSLTVWAHTRTDQCASSRRGSRQQTISAIRPKLKGQSRVNNVPEQSSEHSGRPCCTLQFTLCNVGPWHRENVLNTM